MDKTEGSTEDLPIRLKDGFHAIANQIRELIEVMKTAENIKQIQKKLSELGSSSFNYWLLGPLKTITASIAGEVWANMELAVKRVKNSRKWSDRINFWPVSGLLKFIPKRFLPKGITKEHVRGMGSILNAIKEQNFFKNEIEVSDTLIDLSSTKDEKKQLKLYAKLAVIYEKQIDFFTTLIDEADFSTACETILK
mgnify:CR=1 FL=1